MELEVAQPRLSDLRALDTLDAGQQMRLATILRRVVRSIDDSLPFSSLFALRLDRKNSPLPILHTIFP